MPVLGELARWGYEWAWTAPRPSERVDIAAIFRLAPGLVNGVAGGSVELTIEGGEEPVTYTLEASGGRATIVERAAERPDARVSGRADAWVTAFSPGGHARALQITGDKELAQQVLDGLALSDGRTEGEAAA
jgi:hypothetical protein